MRYLFTLLPLLQLLAASGCNAEGRTVTQEIGRLNADGTTTRVHFSFRLAPEIQARFDKLPKVLVERQNGKFHCWLTLHEWSKGESPWLPGEAIAFYGGAIHAIHGVTFDDSLFPKEDSNAGSKLTVGSEAVVKSFCEDADRHIILTGFDDPEKKALVLRGRLEEMGKGDERVRFGKGFKVRPLKVLWPETVAAEMRAGKFGAMKVSKVEAKWKHSIDAGNRLSLRVTLVVQNTASDPARLSGEMYLLGNDSVLVSRMNGNPEGMDSLLKPDAYDYMLLGELSGKGTFAPECRYYLCRIEAGETRELTLTSELLPQETLRRFETLTLGNLAYGWQLSIPEIPAR